MSDQLINIDVHLETFKNSILRLNHYKSFTKLLDDKLNHYERILADHNIIKKPDANSGSKFIALNNFTCKDYGTGNFTSLGSVSFTAEDKDRIQLELKNRMYQLLLLSAFEAFKKYLKFASSQIKYKFEKGEKTFSPTIFIMHLHKTIPILSTIVEIRSKNNPRQFFDEISLFLTFSIIEQLRHQISHVGGYANDKSLFTKNCLVRIGRYNEGKPKSEHIDYINTFFGNDGYENLICLIEVMNQQNSTFYYDRLNTLIEELASYIFFIHEHLKIKIEEIQGLPKVNN